MIRIAERKFRGFFFKLFALLAGVLNASALPDTYSLNVTNTVTGKPAMLNMQRYDLRGSNFQVRIYSDATNYTLLPASLIPEPTTYRGRIANDPGAMVVGAFSTDGSFYFTVTYGCRDTYQANYDPYDGTNRIRWGGWFGGWGTPNPNPSNQFTAAFTEPGDGRVAYNVATTNIPSPGYTYHYQPNMPSSIVWSSANYPAPIPGYGGPPYFNNQQQVPVQRVRLIMGMDQDVFVNACKSDINFAIAMQESRLNDVDYQQARDFGICYQLAAICIWTNGGLNGDLGSVTGFWNSDPGKGVWFDMVTSTHYQYQGNAWVPGEYSAVDPWFSGGVMGHEMAHNWGANHGSSPYDYSGDNSWINDMTWSAYGHGMADVAAALNNRRNWRTWFEWVKYNSPVAPWATPDYATTQTNQPVSVNVLLNDYIANSNTLSVVSLETNTPAGGDVTDLGNGVLKYTPPPDFVGYDLFHYYVGEPSGLKSLSAVKVLVRNNSEPLLAEWPLNQTSGTNAVEQTGNGPAGLLQGTASFSGAGNVQGIGFGNRALHLDGSGYVRMKGTWGDPLEGSMSISLWCRPDAPQNGNQTLFNKCNESGWRIGVNGTSFYCGGATFGGLNWFNATANLTPQSNTWYHVVGVIDRSANVVRLYVNGVGYTGTSIPTGEFVVGEIWPSIGNGVWKAGDGNFVGAIADVRLYSKALSAAEVQAIYNGSGIVPAGGPSPANGEVNVVLQPDCTWLALTNARHDVYFGTNYNSVLNAATNSSEYQGRPSVASYQPPSPLQANTTYYWRVDALDGANNIIPGSVWSFTTAADALHVGLKWYLSLDRRDTIGNVTYDRAGPPFHDGTLYNSPTPAPGHIQESLHFNGSNQYVETPALNLTLNQATLLAWVRRSGTIPAYAGIIYSRDGSIGRGMMIGPNNDLRYDWNETGDWSWSSGFTLTNGQWTLAAVVITATNTIVYRGLTNGILSSATNNVANVAETLNGSLRVGSDAWVGSRILFGDIDEACIWNRALSRAEIAQVLTNGMNGISMDGARPMVPGDSFTWTGDSDVYWTNSANWAANAVPNAGSTISFDDSATANLNTQLGSDVAVGAIRVTGGIRHVGIGGANTLTLGPGGMTITNAPVNTTTLDVSVILAANQTWNVDAGANLNLNNWIGGDAGLTKVGPGTLTFVGTEYFTGPAIVSGGTLISADTGNWWGSGMYNAQSITINPGAQIIIAGWNALQGSSGANSKPITINAGGVLTTANGVGAHVCGSLTMRGGTLAAGTSYTYWGTWLFFNPVTVMGGTNTSTMSAEYMVGGMTLNVYPGAANGIDLDVTGSFADTPGSGATSVTKNGAGTLRLGGNQHYSGGTVVNAGTLRVDGTLPAGSPLIVQSGAELSGTGVVSSATQLASGSALNLIAGTPLTISSVTLNGAVTVSVSNGASLMAGQTYPLLNHSTISGAGTFNLGTVSGLGAGLQATLNETTSQLLLAIQSTNTPGNLTLAVTESNVVATFYGVPSATYILQRATNLNAPVTWLNVMTNTASPGGILQSTDEFNDLGKIVPGSAFYKLTEP